MIKKELINRSPLRILEKSIKGGLEPGHMGVFTSPKGVGKTACLIHVATDRLLQNEKVIHVSFSDSTDHIESWYEDIYKEIAGENKLEHAKEIHDEIEHHRILTKFSQETASVEHVIENLNVLMGSINFNAGMLVVDGFDFEQSKPADVQLFKEFAQKINACIWFSASLPESEGIPSGLSVFAESFSVIIQLKEMQDHIHLELLKDYQLDKIPDVHLQLDSKTLLIREE